MVMKKIAKKLEDREAGVEKNDNVSQAALSLLCQHLEKNYLKNQIIRKLWKQITQLLDDIIIMTMKMTMTKMRTFTLKELARSFSETILRPIVSCVGSSFPFFGSWMETILVLMLLLMMMNMISVSFDSLSSKRIFKC